MNISTFLHAPIDIQIHVIAAITALVLGPVSIYRTRRDRLHKWSGYFWLVAMLVTIASSFSIFELQVIGPFSPIHALSLLSLWSVWRIVSLARSGRFVAHRTTAKWLYFGGVCTAGLFTLWPGRVMSQIAFPNNPVEGFGAVIGALLLVTVAALRKTVARFVTIPLGKPPAIG